MSENPQPMFKVLKGNPSDSDVAALSALLTQLTNEARRAGAGVSAHGERNLWGQVDERFSTPLQFNPSAFRNVRFY